MERMTMAVPCLFGLEGLVGDELRRMRMEQVRVEDRRVFFEGDFLDMARANLRLRMGERVMILLARFSARSFEELYQGDPAGALCPGQRRFPGKGLQPGFPASFGAGLPVHCKESGGGSPRRAL